MREFDSRRELRYPPFSRLALVAAEAKDEKTALAACEKAAEAVNALAVQKGLHSPDDFEIAGPAPCREGAGKLKRFHFLVKTESPAFAGAVSGLFPQRFFPKAAIKAVSGPYNFR